MIVTVQTLVDRVLESIDMEDGFATPSMVVRELNAAHPRFLFMLEACQWVHNPVAESFTTNGSEQRVLATRAMSVLGVFIRSGSCWLKLKSESGAAPIESTGWYGSSRYRLNNSNGQTAVVFNPPIPAGMQMEIRYLEEPPELVLTAPVSPQVDYVDYPGGWEEWLVLDVAEKMAGREESVNTLISQRKKEIEEAVVSMASNQLATDGARVANVDNVTRPGWQLSSIINRRYRW